MKLSEIFITDKALNVLSIVKISDLNLIPIKVFKWLNFVKKVPMGVFLMAHNYRTIPYFGTKILSQVELSELYLHTKFEHYL